MFPHPALRKRRYRIYVSSRHLLATLFFVAAPFVFLLVFSRFAHLAGKELFTNVFISTGRLLIAYGAALVLAWAAAVLFYRGRAAMVALPAFDVLQSIPTYAALPIATLAWGRSNFTVIFFLVLAVIWPIFFSVLSSLKLIRRDWEEAAEVAGLSGFERIRYFTLPASLPGIITGSIIGLGDGWEALIATEIIVGIQSGLGGFFQSFSSNITITAFGALGLLILIFTINKLIWLPLLEWSHQLTEE